MSTSGKNGGGGLQGIPAGVREIVQSLKEIVNRSEAEIYAALKECDMDPNEAVNRLLTQDPFREVKKKREKKKEVKETTESRPHGSNSSSRGGRTGSDRYLSRFSSTSYDSSDGKSLSHTKENKPSPHTSSLSSKPATLGINRSRGPPGNSDGAFSENKESSFGTSYAIEHGEQPPTGYQSTWGGRDGRMSMADIVKMGLPHGTPSSVRDAPRHNFQDHSIAASHWNLRSHEEQASKKHGLENSLVPPQSIDDEWPAIEKPVAAKLTSVSGYNADSERHSGASIGQYSDDEIQETVGGGNAECSGENDMGSDFVIGEKRMEKGARDVSKLENNLYEDVSSYQNKSHNYEQNEVQEGDALVSSVTKNMQQLLVDKGAQELSSKEEEFAFQLVIPDHLRVHSEDCSSLIFGNFGSGMKMNIPHASGAVTSIPLESHLVKAHSDASIGHPEIRSSRYYARDSPRNASDPSFFHISGRDEGSHNQSSALLQEPDDVELSHGNQYPFVPPLSNVKESYNSVPNREADLPYNPFPGTQLMPEIYPDSVSRVNRSTISMSEAWKTAGLSSSTQLSPENITGTNVANGPPVQQHIAMNTYSQPTLPSGTFTNLMGYPLLPQSYTYLPSAFQQTIADNNTYQALAAAGLQYKNSVPASSLPQSAAVASGYGAFGNVSDISGNFQMNPPSAQSGMNLSYEEILDLQIKDRYRHLTSLFQNESYVPAVPASTYYNYPVPSQNPSGFRQDQQQQPSLGYSDFYHSQTGLSLDHHQLHNNTRDSAAQGQLKQSQIWHDSY